MPKKQKTEPRRSKKEIFQQRMENQVKDFLGDSGFESTPEEIAEALDIPNSQHSLLMESLENLTQRRTLSKGKKGYRLAKNSSKKNEQDVVIGVLRVHPRGFGFLQPEDPNQYPQDIFIPKHLTESAVDGDKVEVVINPHAISEKGPEGRVINILSRGRTHLAGTVFQVLGGGRALAYAPLLGVDQKVLVEPADFAFKKGDRIVMEVLEWGEGGEQTRSKATHRIGHISDPSCDVKAAIEEFELRGDFPSRVVHEAQTFGKKVTKEDLANREDMRKLETFTIDPDTAKDFDDAVSLHKDKKGNYHLAVHVADVSYYVRPGTALDEEANERCNSTYFPGICIPMLPSQLSENLCSLCPNEDRLTVTVLVSFDSEGNQLDYRIVRSVINSDRRFTYKEAKQVLDGKLESPYAPTLHLMVELCGLLKKKRYERGSIEFAMPELVVLVDEKGAPTKTDYIHYDITHQLIEEFMLKANELVATHLTNIGKSLAYRVHDEPGPEGLKDFSSLVAAFGYRLSETPTNKELQKLFEDAQHKPYGEFLATSYIRRMRMAVYSAHNIGHYGLMLTHYCHFTSPIRRYIDLTVHRVLFGVNDSKETLAAVAELCSEQERISARAESSVVQLKKLRLLQKIQQEDPYREFEAIITRVKPFGIVFEVMEYMIEGFLHVSELTNDYYVFDEANMVLEGDYQGGKFIAGNKILVTLKEMDFIFGETKWEIVQEKAPHKTRHKSHKSHKPKKQHKKGRNR